MIDRVSIMTVLAARAGQPSGSGQIFTAEAMRELAAEKPDRFQWDESTGELRRIVNIVHEGSTVFLC